MYNAAAYYDLWNDLMADTQSAALLLAMTNSLSAEETFKQLAETKGFKVAVTEFGGSDEDFRKKIIRAIIGACLNKNIISKNAAGIHAVIHAAEEASKGFLISSSISVNIAVKIAVVKSEHWLSVAFFGYSALHYQTNHKRAGVGTMHI